MKKQSQMELEKVKTNPEMMGQLIMELQSYNQKLEEVVEQQHKMISSLQMMLMTKHFIPSPFRQDGLDESDSF